ncbi:hypothetical protein A1O3_09726 [Capronia epimyces CBS 606.96]|uniref:Uncharacterized protein n=1 Tax=Capronia epimyces CBS 606.96 TaxID=1182542 RepID=W9XJH9_9EURO|nr:uncharacterized protein A1O3_09726 [Capronia epimyces CBS 606.96]EXJ77500.1 hypothetical protein A1O3_09726 [Capronia epimyces CBS 606.96]
MPTRRQQSLDVDFQFGQAGKERKQPGRLEQLGSHVRQKLSKSKLSKNSSTGISLQRLGVENPEAALSQRSTGLLELLMPRGGSEGGYDSDAKSIQTAMLKASDGTTIRSPQAAEDLVRTAGRPTSLEGVPTSQSSVDGIPGGQHTHRSPSSLSTPSKTLFTKIVLEDDNQSPTRVLQRLSVGLASGTIKLGDVNGLSGNLNQQESPSSQKRRNDLEFEKALRRLSTTVAAARTESLESNAENARNSLLATLDPSLINFISKFGELKSIDCSRRSSQENAVDKGQTAQKLEMADQSPMEISVLGDGSVMRKDMASLTNSERSSIHLYNMRISQRLASPSVNASGSRPETSRTSIEQAKNELTEGWPADSRLSLTERRPGWVATEHNKRPSDPRTRRLFEDVMAADKSKSQLRNVVSASSNPGTKLVGHDDASSFYWSDGEVSEDRSRQRSTRRNPNSLAVAGRSESISLPVSSSGGSMGHVSVAGEGVWFGRRSSQMRRQGDDDGQLKLHPQRQRSASMPTGNKFSLIAVGTAPRRDRGPTDDYETLSEISTDQIQDTRREQLTEVSVQAVRDVYDERMSDIDPDTISATRKLDSSLTEFDPFSQSTKRRSLGSSDLLPGNGRQRTESSQGANGFSGSEGRYPETTTDMWRRTLKQAIDKPQDEMLGGFLTAPKFDRNGRRRSSASSYSTAKSDQEAVTAESVNVPDKRSLQQVQVSMSAVQPQSLKLGQTPRLDMRRSGLGLKGGGQVKRATGEKKASKKKSLLDLGKRFTTLGLSTQGETGHGTSTPFRDLLGRWGRFPSYSREARCGPAGASEGVAVRDFALECSDENAPSYVRAQQTSWNRNRSALTLGLHRPPSRRRLPFGRKVRMDKRKSKSLDLLRSSINTPGFLGPRTKKTGTGLVDKWKRAYRSSSSDLRAYTQTYGHRSSISMSASVEYPELEIIAGHDGSQDSPCQEHHRRGEVGGPPGPPQASTGALPWTNMYRECVGSLSALKSDVDLQQMNQVDEAKHRDGRQSSGEMKSTDLRSSTVDFEVQLGREHEAVREGLIRKIENIGKEGSPDGTPDGTPDGLDGGGMKGKPVKQD